MDENLARIERIYPDSKFVQIPKYDPDKVDTKATTTKWRNHSLNISEAQAAAEAGFRIGWIVPKGYVVIDIDNENDPREQEYLEKLLQKFEVQYSYNYSVRGIHILLQDTSNKINSIAGFKCPINIVVDTRANETGYIVLPTNDPRRQWGVWRDVVEDIPYFLKPMCKDNTETFIGMAEGDGRNSGLFRWRSVLESHGMAEVEVEKCIRIINENLFATPMTNQELYKTILRERDNKTKDVTEKDNQYNAIAMQMAARFDLAYYYGNYYKFNGIYYEPLSKEAVEAMIYNEISKNLSRNARNEIMDFLKLATRVEAQDFDKEWYKIACKNGIINLVTGELEQPNKTDYNTIYIPFTYNPNASYSARIDKFMIDLCESDPIKMLFLYQIAGYCLLKKNMFEKFVICKGEGGTGKSTYVNLLHKLVGGDRNCSHVGINDFDKDYHLASMVGKLLNVDDDVADAKVLENTGRFKSIISGNIISVRQIYKEVMEFNPYATCIFCCNRLPKLMDKTSGLYRRMILIELNHRVEHPDPLFMEKITDEDMEYFLAKAVEGIRQAIEEGNFVITRSERQLLDTFRRRQSALNEWCYEQQLTVGDINGKSCIGLYKQFNEWCDINGYRKVLNNFSFKEDMCSLYGMELELRNVNNVPVQIFNKKGVVDAGWRPF